MSELVLILGDRATSSWSLRAYLAMAHTGRPFESVVVKLGQPDSRLAILGHSPAGRVPILRHHDIVIWDSLAIIEYLAETFPEGQLWPKDRAERARARSISAEMHSGFGELRRELPMQVLKQNVRRDLSPAVQADVARICAIWSEAKGPFLFGRFSAADAMYAPVVTRFLTYDVEVDAKVRPYMNAVMALPTMQRWIERARGDAAGL